MSSTLANWNGQMMPLEEVRVSVLDRSFLFGDGIYEVLRVLGGRPFLFREHFDRLRRSLRELRIETDVDRIEQRTLDTLHDSGVQSGIVYLQISRGTAPNRTHAFPNPPVTPNELIYVRELAEDPYAAVREAGGKAITFQDIRWHRCDIKSVNLLGNVLASQAAAEAGCQEAILVAADGVITEGSHTSVFGVKDSQLLTAPLEANVLPGITRGMVVQLAEKAGIGIRHQCLHLDELFQLDELFITGTTSDVLPITQVDGKPIGPGRPGPVAARLFEAYRRHIAEWLEPH